jgi:alpha-tubulin suppressor-like RCC1 family protein
LLTATAVLWPPPAALAQTPTSITVWPPNPTIYLGQTENFAALSGDGTTFAFGDASAISTSGYFDCALLSNGTVQCWGRNGYGGLGNGTTTDSNTPVMVSGLKRVTAIATGGAGHACALESDGTVECWGNNSNGQLGNGTTTNSSTPVAVSGLSGVTAITAGSYFTCALLSDSTVECWGMNSDGQLGNGTNTDSSTPVAVSGLSGVMAIDGHINNTCTLLFNGTVECWGGNINGQLGNGNTTNSNTPVVASVLNPGVVTAVTTGGNHTCVLMNYGGVECFGLNAWGELGNGTTTSSLTPVAVTGLTGVAAISASTWNTCALVSYGTMACWGNNAYGELGNGTTTESSTPVGPNLFGLAAVASGQEDSCALVSDGTVQCWGDNTYGQLGNGTNTSALSPVQVIAGNAGTALPLTGTASLSAGEMSTCALSNGAVQCWGDNSWGELGNGSFGGGSATPAAVSGVSGVTRISAGMGHVCAVESDNGSVWCWGYNSNGQLGNGTTTNSSTPVVVVPMTGATAMGAGIVHTCVLVSGQVECWGGNSYGQLGNGTTTDSSVPVTVTALYNATAVTAHGYHTCALLSNGTVECWGGNTDGELGNGITTPSSVPVAVSGLTGAIGVTTGARHSCALLSGGTVQCWGYNAYGELGNGTTTNALTPVAVSGLSGVKAITAGWYHTCALLFDGTMQCWGYNVNGELGNGTTTNSLTPVAVSGLLGPVTAITAGYEDTCAVLAWGAAQCWGDNTYGELGNGTFNSSSVPVSTSPVVTSVGWSSNNTGVATIFTAGVAASVSVGSALITATYGTLTANTTLTVTAAAQTITFTQNAPASAVYNSTFTVTATGGASGNPVVFTAGGSCSVPPNSFNSATYTMISGTGTCAVIANQAGNSNYSAAPQVTETVNALLASQTITFTVPAPATAKSGDAFTVAATGGASGNGVVFTVGAGSVCTNSGTNGATFTMTSDSGYCYVAANQPGNSNYAAATQVTETVTAVRTVKKVAPTVTFTGAPESAAYLSTFTVATTANSGITPKITAGPATVCTISGTTVTMKSGAGTCTMKASWATNDYYLAASLTQSTTAAQLGTTTTITSTTPQATHPLKVEVYFTVTNGTSTAVTGNVTVTAAPGGEKCTGTVTPGKCLLTFTAAGAETLTAVYAGNTNNNTSTSASYPLTVY